MFAAKKTLIISFFLLFSFFAAKAQTSGDGTLLPNISIEREISENASHVYSVKAESGDFVRVVAQQKDADISMQVFAPDGRKLSGADNFTERSESERISFIAEAGGEYRFEIGFIAKLRGQSAGKSYLIRLEALRPPTEKDRRQIAAERLYDQGVLLTSEDDAGARRASLPVFREALSHFQAAGDRAGEAQTFYALGITHGLLSEFPPARENYAQAAREFRRLEMKAQLVAVIVQDSAIALFTGDNREAEDLSLEALDIYRQLGDRRGEAEIAGNLGVLANRKSDPRKALEYFEQALPILRQEKDSAQEARILRSIGVTYNSLGEPFKAAETLEKALAISRAASDPLSISSALISLGVISRTVGEAQRAIDQLNEALAIVQKLGNRRNEAVCLNNLGANYEYLGNAQAARLYYEKSLALTRELKMRDYEINSLNGIAGLELKEGNAPKALEILTEARQIAAETGNKRSFSKLLAKIGETKLKLDQNEKALELLIQALTVQSEIEDREGKAASLFLIGKTHRLNGDLSSARAENSRALQISLEMKTPPLQAEIYLEMALIEKDAKNLAAAEKNLEKAIEIAESTRSKLLRQDYRAAYFSARHDFYEFYIDVLAAQGKNAEALEASERARARSLIDSLGEARAGIRAGIAPELREKENFLRRTINAKEALRLEAAAKKNTIQAAAFEKEIDEAIENYRNLQIEIRRQSPQFADLTDPEPLTAAEIQARVLDDESILLEYALGAKRSFLFAVTKNKLEVFELPAREIIEKQARLAIEKVKSRDAAANKDLADLSRILLAPVFGRIQNKRLLIVAPGVLQYIPFAALRVPGAKPKVQSQEAQPETGEEQKTNGEEEFLIETNEIVNLPSASVLAVLRRDQTPLKSSTNLLAVLADPVFTKDDARLKLSAKRKADQDLISNQSAATGEIKIMPPPQLRAGFGRLRFSRFEADSILALAQNSPKFAAMDFAANLKAATGEDLQKSRIIHLATHGIINSDFPELSAVVLSLIDENGDPQEGFLRLHDIYNLQLNADLVVLSACETALGKEIKGEGIVGLTRGFMYAGAPAVAASLWKVDDRATAGLMREFYRKMLKENLSPAKALRRAQIAMIEEKTYAHPFFWAAFNLQGDWRGRDNEKVER